MTSSNQFNSSGPRFGALAAVTIFAAGIGVAVTAGSSESDIAAPAEMMNLGLRGVYFVPNEGQWSDDSVIYGFRSRGLDVAFRESGLTMHLRREVARASRPCEEHPTIERDASIRGCAPAPGTDSSAAAWETLVLEVTFPGSNAVTPRGAKPQAAKFNYYIGDDESKWRSDVPSFGAIIYENLYDGIDLHVMGSDGGVLKYEFHCAPGSDHSQIRIHYDGIDSLRIDDRGDLLIETSLGTLRDSAPVVWQPDQSRAREEAVSRLVRAKEDPLPQGRKPLPDGRGSDAIPAHFETLDQHTYTITLLTDRESLLPLVIDPEIEWMTYLGGSDNDVGRGIVVDGVGNSLVTGWTRSMDFAGRKNSHHGGFSDGFALKVSPSGQLQWMTYLGGSGNEAGYGITVDGAGNALLTGSTTSTDFPERNNSYRGGEFGDAFALKLSPSGQLQWMTYLGGSGSDTGWSVAADSNDNALVTGATLSTDFVGRNNTFYGGGSDAFALKVGRSGELQWMTYLGGSESDWGLGIAVDDADNVLVTGPTTSTDFEGRKNSSHGDGDAFALRVSPSGDLEWIMYFGGSGDERGLGIAVDGAGNALMTGWTTSTDFEGRSNSYEGGRDAFALKFSPSGQVQWMYYLGGSESEEGYGIALHGAGNTLVTGRTGSRDFAGRNNSYQDGGDVFALKLGPSGQVRSMAYLGGSGGDFGRGIAVDAAGNTLVTGETRSADFEGRNNSRYGGEYDAFIVRFRLPDDTVPATLTSLDVLDGVIVSGGLPQIESSDDSYLETEARVTGEVHQPHLLRLRITADTDVEHPNMLTITVEGRITDLEAHTTLLLRDWWKGGFQQVDQYSMTMNEGVRGVTIDQAFRFLRASDGLIELEIKQIVFLPFTLNGFHTLFDQVEIAVR